MKKVSFTNNPAPANRIDSMFSSETCFGSEFRVVISSAERLGTEFQVFACIFVSRNGIPSFFYSSEWFRTKFLAFASNFVPWYRIFLLCGTVRNGIPRIFCSAEQPEWTNCSVYSVFRGITFLSEIANPNARVKGFTNLWTADARNIGQDSPCKLV